MDEIAIKPLFKGMERLIPTGQFLPVSLPSLEACSYMSRSSILLPGEETQFQSLVSTSSLKRRPSRLLSIATKKKTKTRILILTNNRLLCVKMEKGGKVPAIRGEWPIPKATAGKEKLNNEKPKPDKEKEKKKGKSDVNQVVVSVEKKGEKEFVVLTVCQTPPLDTG